MPEIVQWLVDWCAEHEHELRSRGISPTVNRPAAGTATRGRPKATAVSLTLEMGARLGKLFVWESGSASLLFINSRTEYTWQEEQVIASEQDLLWSLARLTSLVEETAEQS